MSDSLSEMLEGWAGPVNQSSSMGTLGHAGLREAGLLTGQPRAPEASVPVTKEEAAWPFMT